MQVFRDLIIRGNDEQLTKTIDLIVGSLKKGWVRDPSSEARMRSMAIGGQRPTFCFASESGPGHPPATLFLMEKDAGAYYVPNIVPQKSGELTFDQYNAILFDFCESFIRPAAAQTGVQVDLTDAQVDLEHWLAPSTAKKLRAFSDLANKTTGSAHPSDQERWTEFLVASHREDSTLDGASLRRWLVTVERWPEEVAQKLVGEYEFGRALLKRSDPLQRSA